MPVKKGQEIALTVSDLAFGGKGVARVDGFAVFVDQAVPMDRVIARIVRKKKNWAEARVVAVVEPSPDRVDPPCPYSGTCGGCKWQFLDYDRQIHHKGRQVADALVHIGALDGVRVLPTLPSPLTFGYRNKMEFSCSDRRWLRQEELGKEGVDAGFALGLHVPGTFSKVLDIRACLLQPDAGNRILGEVRDFIRGSRLPVYGLKSHQGFWRFLVLRHSVVQDRWMVNIVTAAEDPTEMAALARRLTAAHPTIASVVNNITRRKSGVAVGEYEVPVFGDRCLEDRIGPFSFDISANSFFQTNSRAAGRLYETVKVYAGLTGGETVVDLYSGTGSIAIYLAGSAGRVTGLEIAPSAVADARSNAVKNGIDNCTFLQGDVRETLKSVDPRPDVLIVDPPRAGMHKDVAAQVAALSPGIIVYVSCNPATLARDLALLRERYVVVEVQPVDMFPHTFHIEAVARLEKIR